MQLVLQGLTSQWVLLQQGDAASLEGGVGQVFGIIAGLGQAEADPELGALVRDAVDTDLATHLLDQPLEMTRPRPVPPGWRDMELSAWLKAWNSARAGPDRSGRCRCPAR